MDEMRCPLCASPLSQHDIDGGIHASGEDGGCGSPISVDAIRKMYEDPTPHPSKRRCCHNPEGTHWTDEPPECCHKHGVEHRGTPDPED